MHVCLKCINVELKCIVFRKYVNLEIRSFKAGNATGLVGTSDVFPKQIYHRFTVDCSDTNEYLCYIHHHPHHWAAVVSRGRVKASACRPQVGLSCAVLCQIMSLLHTFVQVISPPLGWSPLSSCIVVWSPRIDTRGPFVVF